MTDIEMPGTEVPAGAKLDESAQDAAKGDATLNSPEEAPKAPQIEAEEAKTPPSGPTPTQKRWVNGQWV